MYYIDISPNPKEWHSLSVLWSQYTLLFNFSNLMPRFDCLMHHDTFFSPYRPSLPKSEYYKGLAQQVHKSKKKKAYVKNTLFGEKKYSTTCKKAQ